MKRLPTESQVLGLQHKVLEFFDIHGRVLPFRHTTNPYRITVSEFMLHQTQVERVIPKYRAWIKRWPSWRVLAKASRREILINWSGLGYNRRAIYLQECARIVVEQFGGRLPRDPATLEKLPGIGPYTARAILIFAFNEPLAAIDTNIRRVLLHEFKWPADTSPSDLSRLAEKVLYVDDPRRWHYALMDYSRLALPKRIAAVPPITRQSRFEGSIRQIRGEIVRQLTTKQLVRQSTIAKTLDRTAEDVATATKSLEYEGLIVVSGQTLRLREGK